MCLLRKAPMFRHGAPELSTVIIDAYNADVRDRSGFVGDRANSQVLRAQIEEWRQRLRLQGEDDPFGNILPAALTKKKLGRILSYGEPRAAALVHSAVEEFGGKLAEVIRLFLKMPTWHQTDLIVVGGGFCASRLGKLAISRTDLLLKADGIDVKLRPIHFHPDEAGLVGCAHLVPRWMFAGHRAILAVDIGGSKLRAGLIELNLETAADLSAATVLKSAIWRHGSTEADRDAIVARMIEMLERLLQYAEKHDIAVAPFVGIGCPGLISADGEIKHGSQNLPGDWEANEFKLPERIAEQLPSIGNHPTTVIMHNDAVVQGLSERPFAAEFEHWAILTVGTGLGNAHFSTRPKPD